MSHHIYMRISLSSNLFFFSHCYIHIFDGIFANGLNSLDIVMLGVNESNDNSHFPGLLWVLNAPSMLLLIMEPQSTIIINWIENTSLKASYLNAEKLQEDISQEVWDKFSSQNKKLMNEASLCWLHHLPSVWTRTEQNIRSFIIYQLTCTFNFFT